MAVLYPNLRTAELICGADLETITRTRGIGLVAHAIIMGPVGKLRNYTAERWNVTRESSFLEKLKINLVALTPPQAVVYGGMLVAGMTWSGESDWKAAAAAWTLGVGVGAFHAFPYGWFQDRFRRVCGIEAAIR